MTSSLHVSQGLFDVASGPLGSPHQRVASPSPSQRARSVPARQSDVGCLSMLEWKRQNGVLGHQKVFSLSPCKGRKNKQNQQPEPASNRVASPSFLSIKSLQAASTSPAKGSPSPKGGTKDKGGENTNAEDGLSPTRVNSSSSASSSSSSSSCTEQGADEGTPAPASPSPGKNKNKKNGPKGPLDAVRRHFVEKLGWVENRDPNSPFCDFRYSLSRRDLGLRPQALANNKIPYDMCINFFACCGGLTTKSGLLRNLERYMPNVNERIKAGIAPSFDLSDMRSVIHFVDAFQKQQCRSLLYHHFKAKSSSIIPESTLRLAWNTASSCKPPVLSKDQWRQLTIASSTAHTPGYRHPTADLQLGIELTESIKHFGYNGLDGHDNIWILKPTNANRGRGIRVVRDLTEILKYAKCPPVGMLGNTSPILAAHSAAMESASASILGGMNSPNASNALKGNKRHASPGKGVGGGGGHSNRISYGPDGDEKYMVQKYIERPLIINNRKFDIRQWVVVTSFNPSLRVWFYQDAYLRFASHPYSTSSIDDKFAHLTNNAIVKHTPDSGFKVDDTMWHSDKFAKYLASENIRCPSNTSSSSSSSSSSGNNSTKSTSGTKRLNWSDIQRQMKRLVWLSLNSAKDRVVERSLSFELFGYDFMVDECGHVWIIECNSSPDLSFSTSTTRDLVSKMMPDMLNVVLEEEKVGSGEPSKNNKTCGRFVRLEPDYSKLVSPRSRSNSSPYAQMQLIPPTTTLFPFSPPLQQNGGRSSVPSSALMTINGAAYSRDILAAVNGKGPSNNGSKSGGGGGSKMNKTTGSLSAALLGGYGTSAGISGLTNSAAFYTPISAHTIHTKTDREMMDSLLVPLRERMLQTMGPIDRGSKDVGDKQDAGTNKKKKRSSVLRSRSLVLEGEQGTGGPAATRVSGTANASENKQPEQQASSKKKGSASTGPAPPVPSSTGAAEGLDGSGGPLILGGSSAAAGDSAAVTTAEALAGAGSTVGNDQGVADSEPNAKEGNPNPPSASLRRQSSSGLTKKSKQTS